MKAFLSPKKYIQTKARSLPIHECLINAAWKDAGMANILVARKQPSGNFVVGIYLVDLYALGLKDTHFLFNLAPYEYEEMKEEGVDDPFQPCSYELAHNIIYEAIAYAEDLEFYPHKDFSISKFIIEEDTEAIEQMEIECGLNGKPCVMISPEQPNTRIITHLIRKIGTGNFAVIKVADGSEELQEEDEEEMEEEDSYDDIPEEMRVLLEASDVIEEMEKKAEEECLKIPGYSAEEVTFELQRLLPPYSDNTLFDEEFALPENEQNELSELELKAHDPASTSFAIKLLKNKIREFPQHPAYHLLIIAAYETAKKQLRARKAIRNAFDKFPGHIMTRICYGNLLINLQQLEKFDNLFSAQYYLDSFAEPKPTYHLSEVCSFLQMMIHHSLSLDQYRKAEIYMNALKSITVDTKLNPFLVLMRVQILSSKLRLLDPALAEAIISKARGNS